MLSQFFLLLLGEVLLVRRFSLEWQRIERILRMLLVENIIASILPIREVFLIATCSQYGSLLIICFLVFLFLWAHLEIFVCASTGCTEVHLMRVDDFRLFLEVEGLAFLGDDGLFVFPLEIFLVSTQEALRIWVSHKLIGASCFSSTIVACKSR